MLYLVASGSTTMEVTVTVPTPKPPEEGAKPDADKKPEGVAVPPNPELEAANKRIAELNKESEKHRLEAKSVKEALASEKEIVARHQKALKIATGTDDTPDPVKLEKDKADSRVREAYLKSAFVSIAAKEMHDAEFAFGALRTELSGVTVDLETGKADTEALKAKVLEFKTSRPFLFAPPPGSGMIVPPPKSPPDGGGAPAGGDPYKNWQQLKATGQLAEAQKFYAANSAAILKGMK